MFHFPSTLQQGPTGTSKRPEGPSLNATQQKSSVDPIFVKIEEELHDARRVHADGQEDDLRYALDMVINRVTQVSSMLSEAYKAQAELEVQLNVAKSNLKLVLANNEMLEDALKQNISATQSKDVGWNRTTNHRSIDARTNPERSQSVDIPSPSVDSGSPSASTPNQDNRFFKFRFGASAVTLNRPSTPSGSNSSSHLTSPSLPSLSSSSAAKSKEVEALTAELEKEKTTHKKVKDEKAALEAELESLSQALFEEANKMVSDERKMRAEFQDELRELKLEKEALQSALRLMAGEENNDAPRLTPNDTIPSHHSMAIHRHSRTSSQIGIKSRPHSLELALLYPLPPSPSTTRHDLPPSRPLSSSTFLSPDEDQPTPRADDPFVGYSPWADAVSSTPVINSSEVVTATYIAGLEV